MSSPSLREAAHSSKAWPFEEARKLIERLERSGKSEVIFETGYGPSGLPHIGTFGEVARTTMVRNAFRVLTGDAVKTRLIAFSDDMDGLRKTPDNIPNRENVERHLGKPLTQVPDPFGQYESFAAHNNARLRRFLDQFGFEYEFMSSTDAYKSGRFDAALLRMLERFDEVQAIMLPSLREERAATYSPFLPIHPRSGVVMQAVLGHDLKAGTITWRDPETGEVFETPVTGGRCKLQWKPDWAMRWYALGVDYEMAGKDLINSVKLSSRITRVLGAEPPAGFNYELFLDENGQKISKSRGNGLTIEQWLTYASPETLSLFMFQKPMAAKRLYFDVIPRTVDDHLSFLETYPRQEWKERLGNPAWHIHSGAPPESEALVRDGEAQTGVSFAMLLNLAAVANTDNPAVLWGFLRRYAPSASPENHPRLDSLVRYAVAYFRDFVGAEEALPASRLVGARRPPPGFGQTRRDASKCDGGRDTTCSLRHCAAHSSLPRPEGQRRDARAAGRVQQLLQHGLCDPPRRRARSASRLLLRALWPWGNAGADRQGSCRRPCAGSLRPDGRSGLGQQRARLQFVNLPVVSCDV